MPHTQVLAQIGVFGQGKDAAGSSDPRVPNNHGTVVQRRLSKLSEKHAGRSKAALRLEYIRSRIFLSEERYKNYYPEAVYRHKILRPFYTVYRLGKGLVKHPGKLLKEMKELFRK
jgi:hypothetical protein